MITIEMVEIKNHSMSFKKILKILLIIYAVLNYYSLQLNYYNRVEFIDSFAFFVFRGVNAFTVVPMET